MKAWLQTIARQTRPSACSCMLIQQPFCLTNLECGSQAVEAVACDRPPMPDLPSQVHVQLSKRQLGHHEHQQQHAQTSFSTWQHHHESTKLIDTCLLTSAPPLIPSLTGNTRLATWAHAARQLTTSCHSFEGTASLAGPSDSPANPPLASSQQQQLVNSPHLTAVLRQDAAGILYLHPDLSKAMLNAHREQVPVRLQALLDALPGASTQSHPLTPHQLDHLMLLSQAQLVEIARDCGLAQAVGDGAADGTSSQQEVKETAAVLLHDLVMQYSTRTKGVGKHSPAPAALSHAANQATHQDEDGEADKEVELLTQRLWDDSLLSERVRLLQAASSSRSQSETPPHVGTPSASSTPARPGSDILADPGHPYAPAFDEHQARGRVAQTVRSLLRRAGLAGGQLDDVKQLKSLNRAQLLDVCIECGVHPPKAARHGDLALCVAGLVAHAQGVDTTSTSSSMMLGAGDEAASSEWLDRHSRSGRSLMARLARRSRPVAVEGAAGGQEAGGGPVVTPQLQVVEPELLQESEVLRAAKEAAEQAGHVSVGTAQDAHLQGEGAGGAGNAGVTAARQALISQLAAPHQVAAWLQAARAQDVVLVETLQQAGDAQGQQQPGGQLKPVGSYLLVGTAVSARHAAACAEAVRWHVNQRLAALAAASELGTWSRAASEGWRPGRAAGLNPPSDWVALDTGPHLQVHILTEPARHYYQLEAKQVRAVQAQPGHTLRATLFKSSAPQALTLDTIQADADGGSESATSARGGPHGREVGYLQFLLGMSSGGGGTGAGAGQVPTWSELVALGRTRQQRFSTKEREGDAGAERQSGRRQGAGRQQGAAESKVMGVQIDVLQGPDALRGVQQVMDGLQASRQGGGRSKGLLGRKRVVNGSAPSVGGSSSRRPLFEPTTATAFHQATGSVLKDDGA